MKKTVILPALILYLMLTALPIRAAAGITVYLEGRAAAGGSQCALIDGTSYLPLRTAADFYGGSLQWDARTRTARYQTDGLTLEAADGQPCILANGRALYAPQGIFIQGGRLMIPARLLAQALGGTARWDGPSRSVYITMGSQKITAAGSHYDADALYWLSRIISAESRGEPLEGQIAVGNVVLNRVRSQNYPDTIWGVIFDRKHGVQFEPVLNGTVYDDPAPISVTAAKLCLEGVDLSRGSLYFYNPVLAQSSWIGQNCTYVMTIGTHRFYI